MKKKQLFAWVLSAATLVSMAGCGGNPSASTGEASSVSSGAMSSAGSEETKTVNVFTKKREWNWDLIESSFEAANPGYDLVVDITEADSYVDTLKGYLATGDLPDVIQTNSGYNIELWKEHLIDISDMDILSRMNPDIVKEYQMSDGIYGIPLFAEYHGVIYNMDYLGQAGINKAPETLDEFIDMNQKLVAAGLPTGISAWKSAGPITGHMTAPIFSAHDDSLAYMKEIAAGAVDLKTEELWTGQLDYLDAVRTYGNKDALNTDNTTERNAMYAGQYAWYGHDGSWVTPALRSTNAAMEENLVLGVYPYTNDASKNKIGVSTQSLSIMDTPNAENAKVFVTWLLGTDEGCDIMAKECNVVMLRTDYEMTADSIGKLAVQGLELVKAGKGATNFRWIPDEIVPGINSAYQKYIAEAQTREQTLDEIQTLFSSVA